MAKIKDKMLEDQEAADKEFFENNEPVSEVQKKIEKGAEDFATRFEPVMKDLAESSINNKPPRYKFIDEKGQHLHTLDGQPLIGTSAASSVIAKPLTWWASGRAVMELGIPDPKVLTKIKNKKHTPEELHVTLLGAGHMLAKIKEMVVQDYLKLLIKAYAAHSQTLKEKAKEGTDLHKELEDFVKFQMGVTGGVLPDNERILPFVEWAQKNVKRFLWSEGYCYSERLWIGGISDLGYEKLDGTYGIMDFKSSKEAYLPQFWQCAGYDIQISENGVYDANGNLVFKLDKPITEYAVLPFGMEKPTPQFNVDIKGGRAAFEAEILLYKKLN